MNKKLLLLAMALGISATAGTCMRRRAGIEITHGPILGRTGAHQMGVWARTSQPGEFRVEYLPLSMNGAKMGVSDLVTTTLEHDNAAWVLLKGLKSDTRYFYYVIPNGRGGEFRTLPAPADTRPLRVRTNAYSK